MLPLTKLTLITLSVTVFKIYRLDCAVVRMFNFKFYYRDEIISQKRDKKKRKHKHKHKNKHKHSSGDRSKKHKKKYHSSSESDIEEMVQSKKQKLNHEDLELERLEAARKALTAELIGRDGDDALRAINLIAKVFNNFV